jgi:hypothetical protein
MQRYQADHGWQTKVTPDARALIKLGLGPDHEHLLNPETAMTSGPEKDHSADPAAAPASESKSPVSHNGSASDKMPAAEKAPASDKVPASGQEPPK